MIRRRICPLRKKHAFTVLELVIVLVVLAALAGIVVGLFPSLLRKTHAAVATTNLSELSKSLQVFATMNLKQPSRLDSLIEGGATTPYAALPFDATALVYFNPRVPTASEAQALQRSGITEVIHGVAFTPGTHSATFDYGAAVEAISASSPLLFIDSPIGRAHLQEVMNIEPGVTPVGTYVMFGLGPRSTVVGNSNGGIAEAPVHFGEDDAGNPAKVYSRYLLVYRVDGERAKYVGVTAAHDDGLANANSHLAELYE